MEQDEYNELINDLVYQARKEIEEQMKFMLDGLNDNLTTIFDEKLKHLVKK
jgi:hypothetical protein